MQPSGTRAISRGVRVVESDATGLEVDSGTEHRDRGGHRSEGTVPAGSGRPGRRGVDVRADPAAGGGYAGDPPQGADRPPPPPGGGQPKMAHRPTCPRVLPGALAGRAGGLRRHHGGPGRVRPPSDGRRPPPAPPRVPSHCSRFGPGHGGRDPGRIATGDTRRPSHHRPGARVEECVRSHRPRGRRSPPRSLQRPGGGPGHPRDARARWTRRNRSWPRGFSTGTRLQRFN